MPLLDAADASESAIESVSELIKNIQINNKFGLFWFITRFRLKSDFELIPIPRTARSKARSQKTQDIFGAKRLHLWFYLLCYFSLYLSLLHDYHYLLGHCYFSLFHVVQDDILRCYFALILQFFEMKIYYVHIFFFNWEKSIIIINFHPKISLHHPKTTFQNIILDDLKKTLGRAKNIM